MLRRFLATMLAASAIVSTSVGAPPQEVRFTYRPLAVGDQARETTRFAIDLKTILAQDGQVINVADQKIGRNEESTVLRLPAGPGESAKAKVTYQASRQSTQGARGAATDEADRPVAGKTYLAARVGEELIITDEQGETPPEEELAIVTRTMDSLGRPNPLGTFLNGKAVSVGQTLRLPAEYSSRLLSGWDESLAKVPLDVILMGTETVDGKKCALLHTPPAASRPAGQRQPVEGKILVELETCRVAVIDLRGPIVAAERRGPPGEEFDVRRKGKLNVAVHVEHQRR